MEGVQIEACCGTAGLASQRVQPEGRTYLSAMLGLLVLKQIPLIVF